MFLRFMCGEIDEHSQVAAGLFCAASALRRSNDLPDYEFETLMDLKDWFNQHLESPFDYLPRSRRYYRAVCWFKSDAHEFLARAWRMVMILERNDVPIWMIKSPRTGYVYYEDEAQILAAPYNDVRRLLLRR